MYCNQGGVASVLKQRIIHLSKLGHQVELVFNINNGGQQEWEKLNISVDIYENNFADNVIAKIRQGSFDVVTLIDTPALIKPIQVTLNIPIFYEIHTSLEHSLAKINPEDLTFPRLIIVPSNWSKNKLSGMFPGISDRIKVVPNIIDSSLFYYQQNATFFNETGSKIILWVGKINDLKNWQDALRILAKLLETDSKIKLKFVTGGDASVVTSQQFLALVNEYNLINHVDWIHNWLYTDMSHIYSASTNSGGVLLITSKAESFCMVAYEAMRCALPVVAANHYAMADIFVDRENGMLYNPEDTDEATRKIMDLFHNKQVYKSIQKAALETANSLNAELIIENYLYTVTSVTSSC